MIKKISIIILSADVTEPTDPRINIIEPALKSKLIIMVTSGLFFVQITTNYRQQFKDLTMSMMCKINGACNTKKGLWIHEKMMLVMMVIAAPILGHYVFHWF